MLKKSRAKGGHNRSADHQAIFPLPPARDPDSRAEGQSALADKASGLMPDAREPNAAGSDGQSTAAAKAMLCVPPSPQHPADPRIQDIMVLARERTYWLQMRLRNTARLAAELRRWLQPTRGQEEEWDADTKSAALAVVRDAVAIAKRRLENSAREMFGKKPLKAVEPDPAHQMLLALSFVQKTAQSLAEWELEEEAVLGRMKAIAASMAIGAHVETNAELFKGFSAAGLAVLVGHAGDFRNYPKKGHLWKRFGLAPYQKDGVTRAGSSWGRLGGLSKEDWIVLGYKRSRLGDIFGKITQPLLYAQWRTTGAIGPYGEAYGRYKARQKELNEACAFAAEAERQAASAKKAGRKPQKALLEGKLPDSQINARALRYMTKRLITDLWRAWRRMGQSTGASRDAKERVPTAAEPFEREASDWLPLSEASAVVPTAQSEFGEDVVITGMHESARFELPASPNPIQPEVSPR